MLGQVFRDAGAAMENLNERVDELKLVERRQKLVDDHQTIHNRKKNEPCIPILPGHDQVAWFDRLDTHGIWKRVFDFVTNPSDITSAYFTCEMFRKHLEEKRKMMMLPKVFEVLRDTGRLEYLGFTFYGFWKWKSVFNAKRKQANSREILKLRLISKAWKKAAEETFMLPPEFSPKHCWDLEGWNSELNPLSRRFCNVGDVERAMKKLRNTSSCAPLIRVIEVQDENCNDKDTFYSKLSEFLDLHGKSVWGLTFFQFKLCASKDFNYDGLCKILSKMPHLKAFRIEAYWNDDYDFSVGRTGRVELNNSNARLYSMIQHTPFPSLPSLEYLFLYSYPAQYDCLVAEILTKTPNVKGVYFDSKWDCFDRNHVIPQSVWEALRKFKLEIFSFYYVAPGDLCMEDFLRLQQFDWPLKYLEVSFASSRDDHGYDASTIFQVLSRFSDSLVECNFETDNMRFVNDRRSVVIDFPNLKKFILPTVN